VTLTDNQHRVVRGACWECDFAIRAQIWGVQRGHSIGLRVFLRRKP